MLEVACIVEGHGDVDALPILLRRIGERDGQIVRVRSPHRVPRSRMTGSELTRAVRFQANQVAPTSGAVLVVLDSDDDEPATLVASIKDVLPSDIDRVGVAPAVREFEAWFLAGVESLVGHRDVLTNATFSEDPEGPRDAKGRLSELMHVRYNAVRHQPAFAAQLDLDLAERRSPSFRGLLEQVRGWYPGTTAAVYGG